VCLCKRFGRPYVCVVHGTRTIKRPLSQFLGMISGVGMDQKPLVAKYEGGRSVAEFEMFFQSQKQRRSEVMTSDDALQAFDRVLALNSRQTSNTIDGYPSGKGGGTQCPADCARKIKALEQR
jgi:hypothetical protein